MSYPSPSIYTYRITQIAPPGTQAVALQLGMFLAEYSANNGTSWSPIWSLPFQSLQEASQAISILVGLESSFQAQVNAGQVAVVTHWAYPQY